MAARVMTFRKGFIPWNWMRCTFCALRLAMGGPRDGASSDFANPSRLSVPF